MARLPDVAGSVQHVDGGVQHVEGLAGVTVDGFEVSRFSAEDRLPEHETMLREYRSPLPRRISRALAGSVSSNARPYPDEGTGDEAGVAEGSVGGQRLVGEGSGLVGPAHERQPA